MKAAKNLYLSLAILCFSFFLEGLQLFRSLAALALQLLLHALLSIFAVALALVVCLLGYLCSLALEALQYSTINSDP